MNFFNFIIPALFLMTKINVSFFTDILSELILFLVPFPYQFTIIKYFLTNRGSTANTTAITAAIPSY